eukprot:542453-Amorphochlora_amoeboformis.AAC.2
MEGGREKSEGKREDEIMKTKVGKLRESLFFWVVKVGGTEGCKGFGLRNWLVGHRIDGGIEKRARVRLERVEDGRRERGDDEEGKLGEKEIIWRGDGKGVAFVEILFFSRFAKSLFFI